MDLFTCFSPPRIPTAADKALDAAIAPISLREICSKMTPQQYASFNSIRKEWDTLHQKLKSIKKELRYYKKMKRNCDRLRMQLKLKDEQAQINARTIILVEYLHKIKHWQDRHLMKKQMLFQKKLLDDTCGLMKGYGKQCPIHAKTQLDDSSEDSDASSLTFGDIPSGFV